MLRQRMGKIVDQTLRAVAIALFVSVGIAAAHDVSKAWDVWYYHLPFAARITGILDRSSYTFGALNEARFQGFPLLGEALQGLLWRVTGRPESAALLSFLSISALIAFLHHYARVPLHLAWLAFLAIPLVQIHATACYVDVFANTAVALLVMLAYEQVLTRESPSLGRVTFAAALAMIAANSKFQLVPAVLAIALVWLVLAMRHDEKRWQRLAIVAGAVPLVFATPIKNMVRFGNPVWPVELRVFGRTLPYVEGAYASSPLWLEHVPRPIRFAASVLELGLAPLSSHERWSIDQWTPPDHPGYRMGGFFGIYVIANLVGLLLALRVQRSRNARVAGVFFLGATAVASVMPQSHELRYYMFWMLVLVALNLRLWAETHPRVTGLVAAAALAVVAWSTNGTYLYPSGDSFRTLVATKVDAHLLPRVQPNEHVCISRSPWTFLYAPMFHPTQRYSVQEAEDANECDGARLAE